MRRKIFSVVLAFSLLLTVPGIAGADAQDDYEAGVAAHDRGDVLAAMKLLRNAAEQGHVQAMARLAYVLDKAEQNAEAFRLYTRAAEAGHREAALAVGVMYANGEGVERDPQRALQWMTRSARAGHGPATVTLAEIYRRGEMGVKPSRERAQKWLEIGVQAGYEPALAALRQMNEWKVDEAEE